MVEQIFHDGRIMPCRLLTPHRSCASLSRFILRTVSFNCLLNEGKSSLIRGLSPSGTCAPVRQHTQTDKDSSRCGYGYEVNLNLSQRREKRGKKSGKAANKEDKEMAKCSLSKLCPNYSLPKANFHPRFVSANWIPLLQNKHFFPLLFTCKAFWSFK